MEMKKWLVFIVMLGISGVIILTLFHNKNTAEQKANAVKQRAFIPVSTMTVHRRNLYPTFSKTGTIIANNEVSVVSQTAGKVVAVYGNVGSYVKAGAPIAKVDDKVLNSKLVSARTAYEVAQREWERAQKLHQEKIISDSDLETSEATLQNVKASYDAAHQDYNESLITAPISGVITERSIDQGATVSSGTIIATIIDNSTFKITVNVNEENAFQLSAGNKVVIETAVYPGVQLSGRIKSISAKSDAVHTFPVEITVGNYKIHPLKSGVFGKVIFNLGRLNNVLVIPREALVGSIKNPQVYLVEKDHAILRDIIIDSEIGSQLVVKQGLNENDQVVVSGQENLNPRSIIKVIH